MVNSTAYKLPQSENETGRYTKPKKTPLAERKCNLCQSGEIEDELHFVLKCSLYDSERKLLWDSLKSFFNYDDELKLFNTIMTCHNGDYDVTILVQKYLADAFEVRRNLTGI